MDEMVKGKREMLDFLTRFEIGPESGSCELKSKQRVIYLLESVFEFI